MKIYKSGFMKLIKIGNGYFKDQFFLRINSGNDEIIKCINCDWSKADEGMVVFERCLHFDAEKFLNKGYHYYKSLLKHSSNYIDELKNDILDFVSNNECCGCEIDNFLKSLPKCCCDFCKNETMHEWKSICDVNSHKDFSQKEYRLKLIIAYHIIAAMKDGICFDDMYSWIDVKFSDYCHTLCKCKAYYNVI